MSVGRVKVAVCTIIAGNYLALALALAESVRRFHPDFAFYLFVADPGDRPEPAWAESGIRRVAPDALFETATYNRMAFDYDVTELCTAVKPFLLRHLLAEGHDQVYYFDPDILVMQPLDGLTASLAGHTILLTPHILAPLPLDGCLPGEITLLQAGAYNLGFIGVAAGAESRRFLDWWAERLARHCYVAVERGLFVDQKWIDLVPGLFDGVRILRQPTYNVAYWNLHERELAVSGGTYTVAGAPVVFFHFSGFDPAQPTVLSKHQNRLSALRPALAALLAEYAALLARHGHARHRARPYGYSRFSNGVPIDQVARSLMADALAAGLRFADPADVASAPSFYAWINGPARAGQARPVVTRYLQALHQSRDDLRRAFPAPFRQADAFVPWARSAADRGEFAVAYAEAADAPAPTEGPRGVNVAGYLSGALGVGQAARGYVEALRTLGLPLSLCDFSAGNPSPHRDASLMGFTDRNPHPVNLLCVNADQLPCFVAASPAGFLDERHNIGVWWWELPAFPAAWDDRFAPFDEIWAGSTFIQAAIAQRSPIPVIKVPPVVRVPAASGLDRAHFGLDGGEYVFLFIFDFNSVVARKNPLALIAAFKAAFSADEPVRLVIKSLNGDRFPDELARLRAAAADARVTLMDQFVSAEEKDGLLAQCDCYVSLHRAEGFGLTLAEAMALGKPVIATGWSGNMDFMTAANSYPVGYRLVSLTEAHGPYAPGQTWAEPDVAHAAALMREVFAQPEAARARGSQASRDIASGYSPAHVGALIAERLATIATSEVPPPRDTFGARPPGGWQRMVPPYALVMGPGFLARGSRFGLPGLLAKRVLRALYAAHRPGRR